VHSSLHNFTVFQKNSKLVIHSEMISGAAILSGGPFSCGNNNIIKSHTDCLKFSEKINLTELVERTKKYEKLQFIDPLKTFLKQKIFIVHGNKDTVVRLETGRKLLKYYQLLGHQKVKINFDIPAHHAMITNNKGKGNILHE
jgi:hypothetical protein